MKNEVASMFIYTHPKKLVKGGIDMANSSCGKCGNSTFELRTLENEQYALVQCEECGNVVGVLDSLDFKDTFKKIIANQREVDHLINDYVIRNQQGIDRLINERHEEIKGKIRDQDEKLDHIFDSLQTLISKLNIR